jgi:hypothetical protein
MYESLNAQAANDALKTTSKYSMGEGAIHVPILLEATVLMRAISCLPSQLSMSM